MIFEKGQQSRGAIAILWATLLLIAGPASALHPLERSTAFIGWSEAGPGAAASPPPGAPRVVCRDRRETCEGDASNGLCLLNPYVMRRTCPISCNVEACSAGGATAKLPFRHSGSATADGTWAFGDSFRNRKDDRAVNPNHYNSVYYMEGKEGDDTLLLSSLGVGTYLGPEDDETDEALLCALLVSAMRGWNVIDTASNYRGGRSEAVVGRALSLLLGGRRMSDFRGGGIELTRDALFISTKAGYVDADLRTRAASTGFLLKPPPAANGTAAAAAAGGNGTAAAAANGTAVTTAAATAGGAPRRALLAAGGRAGRGLKEAAPAAPAAAGVVVTGGRPAAVGDGPQVIDEDGDDSHVLHLSAAEIGDYCIHPACVRASVERSLERLRLETVDLLYLHNVAEALLPKGVKRADLEAALVAAFGELEAMRREGKLRGYGLATWDCFRVPPDGDQYLSLERVVALARRAGGESHGFMAVQLPVNARMDEAWARAWQPVTVDRGSPLHVRRSPPPPRPPPPASPPPPPAPAAASADTSAAGAVQLPPPPPPLSKTVVVQATLLEAAKELGVLVFGSAPLAEGELPRTAGHTLEAIYALSELPSPAAKLLHFVRSTPGVAAVLVGQTSRDHVESNTRVAKTARLGPEAFEVVAPQVAAALRGSGLAAA